MGHEALLFGLLLLASPLGVRETPLTEEEKINTYRECRVTHANKDKYFAEKLCGCLVHVQAYLHPMPAEQSAPKGMKYSMTKPYRSYKANA